MRKRKPMAVYVNRNSISISRRIQMTLIFWMAMGLFSYDSYLALQMVLPV